MRVLLCQKQTGLYYRSPGQWIADTDLADDFGSSRQAALFAEEQLLKDAAEVLLDFNDPEYNVYLPVERILSVLAEHALREQHTEDAAPQQPTAAAA